MFYFKVFHFWGGFFHFVVDFPGLWMSPREDFLFELINLNLTIVSDLYSSLFSWKSYSFIQYWVFLNVKWFWRDLWVIIHHVFNFKVFHFWGGFFHFVVDFGGVLSLQKRFSFFKWWLQFWLLLTRSLDIVKDFECFSISCDFERICEWLYILCSNSRFLIFEEDFFILL